MFPILTIPPGAAEILEQMGTKSKFWYVDSAEIRTLFKEGRPNTGENWAEKLACELAGMLGLPHAAYELALYKGRQGVSSPSFVPKDGRLIHGNELVIGRVTTAENDEKIRYYVQRSHVASRVLDFLKNNSESIKIPLGFSSIEGVYTALDVFTGYVLFDAWIANQDRHAENWGVIEVAGATYLAPTYDHGSSMGRNETDERRNNILTTKDRGSSMSAYVKRAHSALYPEAGANVKPKAYLTHELFEYFRKENPEAGEAWMVRLKNISMDDVRGMIEKVPHEYMTDIARNFTTRLLETNLNRLLAMKNS